MLLTKIKTAAVALVVAIMGLGGGMLTYRTLAVESRPTVDERKAKTDLHGDPLPVPKERAKPGPAKPVVVRQDAALQRMAMSPDGAIVATVGVVRDGSNSSWFNSTVKLWDARTGKLMRALDEEKDSHLEIAFSHDLLAIGVNGKLTDTNKPLREVRLLDARTLKPKHKIDKTLVPGVRGWGLLAFSADGKRLAVTGYGEGAFLKLWDVEKEEFIERKADLTDILREQLQAKCLAFSPDGKLVAAEWDDGKIRLFDGQTGEFRKLLDRKPEFMGIGVGAIAFSPDSKTLASRGNDNTVLLWDLTERKPPRGEGPDEKKIKQLIANLDADEFATRERASKELEKLAKSAEGPMRDALAAAGVSPEAKRRLEQLLKNMEGNPGRTLKGQKGGEVYAVSYSRDGRWIAIGSRTAKAGPVTVGAPLYEVILRDAKTGEVKQTLSGLTEWVHVIAFTPDGKTLAVCGGAFTESGNNIKASGELTLFRLE